MASDGGFDAKTGRQAYTKLKRKVIFTWGKGFHLQLSLLESDTLRQSLAFFKPPKLWVSGPNLRLGISHRCIVDSIIITW
jgi:hypothetical protein